MAAHEPSRPLSLNRVGPSSTPEILAPRTRIGTSGWHYRSWHGPFYPSDLKIKDFLAFYVTRFDTAEINNSFYRLPSETAVKAWRDSTPEDFLFAWKVSRFITHMKRLKDVADSLALVFGHLPPARRPQRGSLHFGPSRRSFPMGGDGRFRLCARP